MTGFAKTGTSRIFERACFKDAYLVNAVRYPNETWIGSRLGSDSPEMKPFNHTARKIRDRVRGTFDRTAISKNDGPTKAHITEMERATDL